MTPELDANSSGTFSAREGATEPEFDRADVGVALLLEQTARAVYDRRSPKDIHPGQWSALRYFGRAGRFARTVNGLATYLGVTTAPASRAAAALVARGLVASEPHPTDRRSQIFSLTDAGRQALADDPIHRLARAVAKLPDPDRSRLVRQLDTLRRELDSRAEPG